MNSSTYEKTISISIPIKNQPKMTYKELGLTNTCFDPSKMSPPNYFMDKLAKRMDTYYSSRTASPTSSRPSSPLQTSNTKLTIHLSPLFG
jgi:hypothetical protein